MKVNLKNLIECSSFNDPITSLIMNKTLPLKQLEISQQYIYKLMLSGQPIFSTPAAISFSIFFAMSGFFCSALIPFFGSVCMSFNRLII